MNFNKVLSMATNNKQYSSYVTPAKRYSTELPAPKKPPKSNVQSDAVKAFLAKKQREEDLKTREFERRKQDLLELRSIAKHNRKATAMAKRTKDNNFMATFSFMEELAKNGDNTNASMLQSSYRPCDSDVRPSSSSNRKLGQQAGRSPPYRGVDSGKYGSSQNRPKNDQFSPSYQRKPDNAYQSENARERKGCTNRKPHPPTQGGLNFHELLKLAEKKQHEPVDMPKVKKPVAKDIDFQGRPMTNDEKRRFIEEQTRKQGRSLADATLPPTSRRRKKFRHDADSDELVASNLATPSTSSRTKMPSSGRPLHQPTNVPNAGALRHSTNASNGGVSRQPTNAGPLRHPANASNAGLLRQSTNMQPQRAQNKPPVPKSGVPRSVKNGQNPSALKHNREPVLRPTKVGAGVLTSNKMANGERTKGSTGPPKNKYAPPAKLPPRRDEEMRPKEMPGIRKSQALAPSRNGLLKKSSESDRVPGRITTKAPTVRQQLPMRDQATKQFPPRNGNVKQFSNRDVMPKQLPSRDAHPKQLPPRDLMPKQFPPRDLMPKQFPPRDLMPKQFPPRDLMPRQFPPRDVRRLPPRPMKRRIESDDEYDDEMNDFIDDEPIDGENMDVSEQIKEIFGYDRNKYRYEPEDDLDIMESSFAQQMREEAISTKMGILEDLEDIRREQEELRGKASKVLVGKVPKKKQK